MIDVTLFTACSCSDVSDVIKVPANVSQEDLEAEARRSEKVTQFINGKAIRKVIVVPRKLVNIVVS